MAFREETSEGAVDADERLAARLRILKSYGILDTSPEDSYDDIVKLAAYVCGTPIALVSLVEEHRQWFKAEVGLGACETPIGSSVCALAILQPGLFVVSDLQADRRFDSNPLTRGPDAVRFYAGAPLITPEGHAIGTVCVLDTKPRTLTHDQGELLSRLARQTMLQLELRKTVAMAEKAARYRSRLMAIAGHDLKQPLQVISMILSHLRHKVSDAVSEGRVDHALGAIDTLSDGLDELAHSSRLGGDARDMQIQGFPVSRVLGAIATTWREHAEHKGLQLKVMKSSALVASDPTMLTTIIANLVGNAIKYTHAGRVVVGCRRLKYGLRIAVLDSGIGIDYRKQEGLFEAFHQEDGTSDGLGLGLSIVQRTADILGYRVRILSTPGKGSQFSIDVPLSATVG